MEIIIQSGDIRTEYPEVLPQLIEEEDMIRSLGNNYAPKDADMLIVESYMGNSPGGFLYIFRYGKKVEGRFKQVGETRKYSSKDLACLVNK